MGEPNTRFGSYIQGIRDTYEEIGMPVPDGCEEGDSPSISGDYIDIAQYQRGQIQALTDILKKTVCK